MSRSQPVLQNPCKKFIEFKSDKGAFFYFDKTLGEHGENVEVKMPIFFVVLDELNSIGGFNDEFQCSIYSNEVHRLGSEILRVRTAKGGRSVTGLYKEIQDSVKAMGGRFTKSVYAMLLVKGEEPELVNFRFKGAAFSAWIDKKVNANTNTICVKETTTAKKGSNTYTLPVFSSIPLPKEVNDQAIAMDAVLQEYLVEYKKKGFENDVIAAEAAVESVLPEADALVAKAQSIAAGMAAPKNPLLEGNWQKEGRAAKGGKQPAVTSDPALLGGDDDQYGGIDPSDLPF